MDYYKELGINRNSSQADIKKAYRSLARKFHPDLNPGDFNAEERFKSINEAYEANPIEILTKKSQEELSKINNPNEQQIQKSNYRKAEPKS